MAARDEAVQIVLKAYGEARTRHTLFCNKCLDREKAYLAILDDNKEAASWQHRITPPYAMQIIDTVVANLTEDRIGFRVRPFPRMESYEEVEHHVNGAKAHDILLHWQLARDRFSEKQGAHNQQHLVTGLSVLKPAWEYRAGKRKTLVRKEYPQFDDYGNPTGIESRLEEVEIDQVQADDNTCEVVRVEDFIYDEAAYEIQKAEWCIHRVASSFRELKEMESVGIYQNVDALKDEKERDGTGDEFYSLDEELRQEKRFKNRIEILEYWSKDRVITVANRRVKLRDIPNPFWHGEYPFITTSSAPLRFSIQGRSLIERIRQLQEYLWSLMNQRLDNLELINNAIVIIRDDILDTGQFKFHPGAKWFVDGDVNNSVSWFQPNPAVAQLSLEAEAMMKGDLQNITGGMPFMSGTNSQTVDQQTATGVSIITNLAQKMVAHQKQFVNWSFERMAQQWVENNAQFIREDRLIPILGVDGAQAFQQINGEILQGTYIVNADASSESMNRQEKRAEAQALLQMALSAAPFLSAAAMSDPSKRTVNVEAYMEKLLKAFDEQECDKFFSNAPQPQMMGMGGQGGQGGQAAPTDPTQQNLGITAPQAADASSPSNATSQSPGVFMQRALAMGGRQS
jgi:hypothetical protein